MVTMNGYCGNHYFREYGHREYTGPYWYHGQDYCVQVIRAAIGTHALADKYMRPQLYLAIYGDHNDNGSGGMRVLLPYFTHTEEVELIIDNLHKMDTRHLVEEVEGGTHGE